MKKSLIFAFLIIFGTTTIFANVEIDVLSYNGATVGTFERDEINRDDHTNGHLGFLGSETSINFFFPRLRKNMELGLNIDFGFDIDPNYGIGMILSAAPVFRYSFNEKNSISLAGGLGIDGAFSDKAPWFMEFVLTVTYKRWLVNKNGFHLGLCPGISLMFPFSGGAYYEGEEYKNGYWEKEKHYSDLISGFGARLFFGLCFNFGDRSIDF